MALSQDSQLCEELCFGAPLTFLAGQMSRAKICFLIYIFQIELFVEMLEKNYNWFIVQHYSEVSFSRT